MSREIDRKVAEALGWKKSTETLSMIDREGNQFDAELWVSPNDPTLSRTESRIPRYSTDIAAAIGARDAFLEASDRMTKIHFFAALRNSVSSRRGGMTDIRDVAFYMNAEDICAAILAAHTAAGEGENAN